MSAARRTLGAAAVRCLAYVQRHFDHVIREDEVTALTTLPHTCGFKLGHSDGCLGLDRVEVVVQHETGVPIVDAVHDPKTVELYRRPTERWQVPPLKLDERAVVIVRPGHGEMLTYTPTCSPNLWPIRWQELRGNVNAAPARDR